MSRSECPSGWTPRSELQLLHDQLTGLSAWHGYLRTWQGAELLQHKVREVKLDGRRRCQARQRAHDALLAQVDTSAADPGLDRRRVAARAVLVLRQPWLRDRVSRGLQQSGVQVLAQLEDGADALGVVVAEQPDLVLLEQALPSLPGRELIGAVRGLAPRTLVAAQVHADRDVAGLLEVGAAAVFTRRVPPADLTGALTALLRSPELSLR